MRALNALLPPEATASATSTRHTLAGPQRARAPLLWFAVSVTLAALFSYFSWIPMFISIVGIQPDPGALSGPIIRVETIQGIVVSEGAGTQTGSAIEFFLFPAGSALSMAPLDHLSGSVSLVIFCHIGFGIPSGFGRLSFLAAQLHPTILRSRGRQLVDGHWDAKVPTSDLPQREFWLPRAPLF